jgi:hypothetical protein
LLAALDRQITLLGSIPLMLEYEAVPTRPEHLKEIGLRAEEISEAPDALAVVIEPVARRTKFAKGHCTAAKTAPPAIAGAQLDQEAALCRNRSNAKAGTIS